jgi:hypothetical protein
MMTLTRPKVFPNLDTQNLHRMVAVGSGLALTVVAAGLFARASWATALWPWADVKMTYVFLASVLAAAIAPSIWIGLTGEMAVLAPGALNTLILNLAFAAYLGFRGIDRADFKLVIAAGVNLAVVPFFVSLLRRSRTIPVKDTRPMPRFVTYALWAICGILIVVGLPLLFQVNNIFPWDLTPQTSTIFGCVFLGASGYFFYVARQPYWIFGLAPLLGFLGYDVVLLAKYTDFLRHPSLYIDLFRRSSGESPVSYGAYASYSSPYDPYTAAGNGFNELSLAVYLAVLVVSALFTLFLLFIYRPTRVNLRSLQDLRRPALLFRNAA